MFNFGFQRAGVGRPALIEQIALFGGERLALVGKANALVVGELEGQRLNFKRIVLSFKGGLLDLNWSNLAPALTATSNTATATLTVTNAQGFYRVQLVP